MVTDGSASSVVGMIESVIESSTIDDETSTNLQTVTNLFYSLTSITTRLDAETYNNLAHIVDNIKDWPASVIQEDGPRLLTITVILL